MDFRHEIKHEISYCDMLVLRQRLDAVMRRDGHAINGKYEIRSLYFDNARDKALNEKRDGVNVREKFRLRLYNADASFICLEKKSKINGLTAKQSERVTADEARKIINGDTVWMAADNRALITELYAKMRLQGLKPKTLVDYTREAFTFAPGNVRVTLDYNIRTGLADTDLFSFGAAVVPSGEPVIILEVKWDAFLPDIIRDAVSLEARRAAAFSKYEQSRIYY